MKRKEFILLAVVAVLIIGGELFAMGGAGPILALLIPSYEHVPTPSDSWDSQVYASFEECIEVRSNQAWFKGAMRKARRQRDKDLETDLQTLNNDLCHYRVAIANNNVAQCENIADKSGALVAQLDPIFKDWYLRNWYSAPYQKCLRYASQTPEKIINKDQGINQ